MNLLFRNSFPHLRGEKERLLNPLRFEQATTSGGTARTWGPNRLREADRPYPKESMVIVGRLLERGSRLTRGCRPRPQFCGHNVFSYKPRYLLPESSPTGT